MKFAKSVTLNEDGDFKSQIRSLNTDLDLLSKLTQGRVAFGSASDGARGENISGEFAVKADMGAAGTEWEVTHGIGSIPVGYLVISTSKAGSVYKSNNFTATKAYFKSDVNNMAATVFLLKG